MDTSLNFLLLSANGIFTCICGLVILQFIASRKIEKHPFYYAWAIGFVLYGVQIIMRALSFPFFISATLMSLAVILFLGGTWSLTHKRRLVYMFILNFIALSVIGAFYLLNVVLFDTALPLANSFWPLIILVSVLYSRVVFGKSADKFSLGWTLLFLSNALLWGFEWIDLFAIFAKFIILWGIMDYDFVIVTERVRKGLDPQLPPIYTGVGKEGGLKLVINESPTVTTMENWTYRKARENAERDVRTYIFSFQDVISHSALRKMKWIKPEKVFVFLFSSSSEKAKNEFTVLPMGLTQIGAALSEIIKTHSNPGKGFTLIFLDLSLLVHSFGVHEVYNVLLNKMGSLREGEVDLFAFFSPRTHSDKSIAPLFTGIADEIIRL